MQLEPLAKRIIDYNEVTSITAEAMLLVILPDTESDRTRWISLENLKASIDALAT